MRQSIPLVDSGTLVGVATKGDCGWYLIALDARLEELDRVNFRDAAAAERAVRAVLDQASSRLQEVRRA
ncbi:MAG: hypothetical protein K2X11_17730 [Acetobacteraceae bacterium]|nr:hypothetical protein [Acetobacteraceae bacterium]